MHAGIGLEAGKQFTYDVTISVGSGTLDYAPHTAGWVSNFKLKLQVENANTLHGQVTILHN